MAHESIHHITDVEVDNTMIPWEMVGQICPTMFRNQVKFKVSFELTPDGKSHVGYDIDYDDKYRKTETVRKRVNKFLREHCKAMWSIKAYDDGDTDYDYGASNDLIWIVFESTEEKTVFVKNCLMKLKLTNADHKALDKVNQYY